MKIKTLEFIKEVHRVIFNYEFFFLVSLIIMFFYIGGCWEKEWVVTWKLILWIGMGYFIIKWWEKVRR